MRLTLYKSGETVRPGERLAEGGEAVIHRLEDRPGLLAKLYHPDRLDAERIAKIAALVAAAPEDPSLGGFHRAYAWPEDALLDETGRPVGVAAPEAPGARSLTALSSPKLRRRKAAEVNWSYLHAVAANLAFCVGRLHEQGLVIGDLKPDNVLVDDRALVTLIDCDSWQIPDPRSEGRAVFACPVGSEGFTAPELIGKPLARTPRTAASDRFALAALIFQLLLGRHPWSGVWIGGGEPPSRDALIRSGDWPHRHGARLIPPETGVPFEALDPRLVALFRRAFEEGCADPAARPGAADWQEALCLALADLAACAEAPSHYFLPETGPCPWCRQARATGVDPFPEPPGGSDPLAPLALAFERALARGDARMALELWRENDVLAGHRALRRYAPRMAEIGAALDAFDGWRALYLAGLQAETGPDWLRLARLWESAPALADARLIAGEDVAGRPASEVASEVAERALAIPLAPPERLLVTPPEILRAAEARRETMADAAARTDAATMDAATPDERDLDIPPPPRSLAETARGAAPDAPPLALRYSIDAGWAGLRPAMLTLALPRSGRLPALALVCEETGAVALLIPAGRRPAGAQSVPFEQPERRTQLILRTVGAGEAARVAIEHPPASRRRVGAARPPVRRFRPAPA